MYTKSEANSLVALQISAFGLVQRNQAAVKLESSAVVSTYIFSIISELNKEFPAISGQFVFVCLTGLTLSAYKNPISPNIYPVVCTLLRLFVLRHYILNFELRCCCSQQTCPPFCFVFLLLFLKVHVNHF